MNRLLNNKDRADFEPLIADMFKKCPAMMARKIKLANVQQAFVINTVQSVLGTNTSGKNILCAGCFEDTAFEYLKATGLKVEGMDPAVNVDLHTFKTNSTKKWDVIFSTSVIEHVEDDELFVKDICELLASGGTAILTCDFKDGWKVGDPLHPADFRFYTGHDLEVRLGNIIKQYNCKVVSEPQWAGEPEFFFDGFAYNFATWVFKKEE